MFESTLLSARKGRDARLIRAIVAASITLQASVLAAVTLGPLIYPDTLPSLAHPARMTHIELIRPRPVAAAPPKTPAVKLPASQAITAPAHSAPAVLEVRRGGMITHSLPVTLDQEPALALGGGNVMGTRFNPGVGPGASTGSGTSPLVVAAAPRPAAAASAVRVSSGVLRGLLLAPIQPTYPAIARAARVEGTVTIAAVIDRVGRIINAQIIDGPVMLRDAAISAVRDARYQPYLLNGRPTEVVTTISVTFRMSV